MNVLQECFGQHLYVRADREAELNDIKAEENDIKLLAICKQMGAKRADLPDPEFKIGFKTFIGSYPLQDSLVRLSI